MKKNKTPKLELTAQERQRLRAHKSRLNEIHKLSLEDLSFILKVTSERAREIKALSEFQSVPSIGPQFAKDLMKLGYYELNELKNRDGAALFEDLERLIKVRIDPCVEDQFRLIVFVANHPGSDKQWWDFTEERKTYRAANGYANRPD
ncbi:helix-hairpin-helix domain-containing protein [Paenibacillus sp. JX-17]|uniref:Helix-hairpin-helix domain-containing protein n=1 Tax=Paenibacillus lacisoli TaxID=3064525 RepID=A0ABT9C8R5_9BACL|nr:helix-hairpin-helix domain-containing protein [Paenibacillus sp. JX-17]MDO7905639.1 helix-hairpin-helix domain-containing protein [Paenibacillus sp. JX-17]